MRVDFVKCLFLVVVVLSTACSSGALETERCEPIDADTLGCHPVCDTPWVQDCEYIDAGALGTGYDCKLLNVCP